VRISSARFVKSAIQPDDFPHDKRPEVAFCGRSNIGKSSLLNALTNSRGLARTSSTPGRTQTINFFLVDEQVYFVDLPGYGYARVSKTTRDSLGKMIESYLAGSRQLKLALMLVDCRIPPTESDRMMKEWLDHYGIPNAVVLTKADKLSKNKLNQALKTSAEQLRTKETIAFSAITGFGKDAVLSRIRQAIAQDPTQ
jgi:GTP-binding protein